MHLSVASNAVTTGFGVKISQVSDVEMSDNLSSWLSTVHLVLHPSRDSGTAASSNNPNPNRNIVANPRSKLPPNRDESIMAQILQSQQGITDHLVHSNKTSALVQC